MHSNINSQDNQSSNSNNNNNLSTSNNQITLTQDNLSRNDGHNNSIHLSNSNFNINNTNNEKGETITIEKQNSAPRNNSDSDLFSSFSISRYKEMYKNNEVRREEPIQLIDDSTNLQLLLFKNTDLAEHLKYLEIVREEQH